jgi:hypothetical protein
MSNCIENQTLTMLFDLSSLSAVGNLIYNEGQFKFTPPSILNDFQPLNSLRHEVVSNLILDVTAPM